MALEARSSVVAMATKSLSPLVAAERYRHKLDHMVLTTQGSNLCGGLLRPILFSKGRNCGVRSMRRFTRGWPSSVR